MIQLSATAQARYSNLKVPPTHAVIASRALQYGHNSPYDVVGLTLAYWLGTLDATGHFIVDPTLGTIVFQVPTPEMITAFTMPVITLVLSILYGAGIAPDPLDVKKFVSVPSKLRGDCKIADLHTVAMFFAPALNGTPVPPAPL